MLLFDVGLGWVTENGPTAMSGLQYLRDLDSYCMARLSCGRRVRLSVRLSHVGIDSKLMTVGSRRFYFRLAHGLLVF